MILKLARRDPGSVLGLAFIGTYLVVMYLVVLLIEQTRMNPGNWLWNEMAMFAGLMFYLKPQRRATLWEAALPIPARQLFLARTLSRMAMVWIPMMACGSLTMLLKGAEWSSVGATLACGAGLTLAILLPQAVRVQELVIPWWLVAMIWAAVAAAGLLTWWLLPAAVTLTLFALASAGAFVRIWMTLPLSFQTAPLEAAGGREITRSRSTTALPWWPVVRSLQWASLGFLPMIAVLASQNVGLFGCLFGVFGMEGSRPRTRWLDSLPLSHRARLLINLIPVLVIVVGGTALGLHFATDNYPVMAWDPATLAAGLPAPPAVAVSLEYWKHAQGGIAPLIQSPWGETFRPAIRSVFGYKLYDPYSSGPDNSHRFFDWQYERATEVVYGRSLTAPQLNAARKAGLRPITTRARMQILNLAAATLFVLVLIFLRELFRWHRARRLSRLARGLLMAAVVAPPFGAILALDFIPGLGSTVGTTIHVIQGLLLRISTLLPDNLLAVTMAALAPVVLMYLLLERLFARTELLGPVRVVSPWSAEG
ncbi:MAG: hypothetical protein ABSH40_03555 [Bryobacteraceae bacterium]